MARLMGDEDRLLHPHSHQQLTAEDITATSLCRCRWEVDGMMRTNDGRTAVQRQGLAGEQPEPLDIPAAASWLYLTVTTTALLPTDTAAAGVLVGDINTDLTNLSPIFGLAATPKVSLREALEAAGVGGLAGCLACAELFAEQHAAQHPADALDREESAALNLYTMESPFYPALNRALGSKDRALCRPFFKYLRLALGAMYRLPLVRGLFARGIRNPAAADYQPGRPDFVWWAFTSTTQNVAVTKDFLGDGPRMLFMIDGTGVDISPYSAIPEAEVIVLPGSRFRLQGCVLEAGGGLSIATLQQVPSPPMLDFAHPGIAAALGSGGA
jgi:hypothetical protein